ncbi:MAG: hypothetical protein JXA37_09340 [Chloroflexia bacterium]|nr:hypothetical protein [Chloroflexia bacterium]
MSELETVDVQGLDIFENPCDLRRDLHVFMHYVQERQVQRLYRDNALRKADYRRLAKLMTDLGAKEEIEREGYSSWVDFVDKMALKLGFVHYDTKGVYVGYSSASPSFPDNVIDVQTESYQRFLQLSMDLQEHCLLDALIKERDGCNSEFYHWSILGRLDPFSSRGCATGIVPKLDFVRARRFLLGRLQSCPAGAWYSTASLIQHLKREHPFFLIPQRPEYTYKGEAQRVGRYGNFYEGTSRWGDNNRIPDEATDAFERVEGRYVERFLEGAPLVLGYVDVAYAVGPEQEIYPSLGQLEAFRVRERLRQALNREIPRPNVTVQPNFEVYVESLFYPASVMQQLDGLVEVVSEGLLTVLRLRKELVSARVAEDETLDVVSILARLSGQELPPNVDRELSEWSAHSDKFLLYEGLALLEGEEEALPPADPFTVERISPCLRLVRSVDALFGRLEKAGLLPLRVRHPDDGWASLPEGVRTLFPRPEPEPPTIEPVRLLRQVRVTLHVPEAEIWERIRQVLIEMRCPVEARRDDLTISFSQTYQAQVDEAVASLDGDFDLCVEDVD